MIYRPNCCPWLSFVIQNIFRIVFLTRSINWHYHPFTKLWVHNLKFRFETFTKNQLLYTMCQLYFHQTRYVTVLNIIQLKHFQRIIAAQQGLWTHSNCYIHIDYNISYCYSTVHVINHRRWNPCSLTQCDDIILNIRLQSILETNYPCYATRGNISQVIHCPIIILVLPHLTLLNAQIALYIIACDTMYYTPCPTSETITNDIFANWRSCVPSIRIRRYE